MSSHAGLTLPELVAAMVVAGVMAATAVPPMRQALDRLAVRHAADRYALALETARQLGIARGRSVRLALDTAGPTVTLAVQRSTATWDTVSIHALGRVGLTVNQPLTVFGPVGLAMGVSNATIIFARGAVAETLTVSRTGRLKRGLLLP